MPETEFEVTPKQIRILSDPSRLRILSMLFEEERSISGLAKALRLTPATVHHHVQMLKKAGLIRATRSETRGNLVETYYEMPAKGIDSSAVWNDLRGSTKVAYRLAILGMLKGMINDAMRAIERRGTVEWEVGRLLFYRLPWRRDAIQQAEEIMEEARRRLERLERKYGQEGGPGHVAVVMTTLPG